MPASLGGVLAGAAFIKMTLQDAELQNGLKNAQRKMKAFCNSVNEWSTKMTTIAIAAGTPMLMAAKRFADFDDQMRLVAAVSGATGREFENLTALAKELGKTTSFTAQQVAAGMTALARMGFTAAEITDAIRPVMNLSRATGTELAEAADIAGNALRAMGMSTAELGSVVDVLTVTANGSAQTLTDLGEALKYAAPAAATVGEDIRDVNAALGVLANVGIKGSLAGTALKRAYSQLAKTDVQAQLASIGVTVIDNAGNMRKYAEILRDCVAAMHGMGNAEKLAFATEVFGERAAPGVLAITADIKKIDDFLDKLKNAEGAAGQIASNMDAGAGGKFRALASAAEAAAISIGEIFAEAFTPAINALVEFAQWLADAFKDNAVFIKDITQIVASIVTMGTALKGVILIGGGIKSLIAPIIAVTTALDAAAVSSVATGVAAKGAAGGVNVLSGSLTLLAAHPVTAALLAIGAAFAAVAIASAHARAEAEKQVRIAAREAEAARKAREEKEKSIRTDNRLMVELQALAEKTSLSAAEMKRAETIIAALERRYGKLGITIDQTKGRIEGLTGAQQKLSQQQQEEIIRELENEKAKARTLADAKRNAIRKSFDFGDGIAQAWGGDMLNLLVKMGYEKQRGNFTPNDWRGKAVLGDMEDALIFAEDNGMDAEAQKLREIIELLKKEQELEKEIAAFRQGQKNLLKEEQKAAAAKAAAAKQQKFMADKKKYNELTQQTNATHSEIKDSYVTGADRKMLELDKKQIEYEKTMKARIELLQKMIDSQVGNVDPKIIQAWKKAEQNLKNGRNWFANERAAILNDQRLENTKYTGFTFALDEEDDRKEFDSKIEFDIKNGLFSSAMSKIQTVLNDLAADEQSSINKYKSLLQKYSSATSEGGAGLSEREKRDLNQIQQQIREIRSSREKYDGKRREIEESRDDVARNPALAAAAAGWNIKNALAASGDSIAARTANATEESAKILKRIEKKDGSILYS